MLEKGMVAAFLLQFLFWVVLIAVANRAKAGGRLPDIRRMPALDAMDEAIGRATEMGRPVHYTSGLGDVKQAQTLAAFSILGHVARRCAASDTRIIVTSWDPIIYSAADAIVQQQYAAEGKADAYDPADTRFLSNNQFAYASGVLSIMEQEKVATNIMMGYFMAESLFFAEGAFIAGAVQIAGTANVSHIPFFIAACDYALIGDELFAAGAYLSRDPMLIGNLVAQDYGKLALIVLGLVGIVSVNLGSTWVKTILSK